MKTIKFFDFSLKSLKIWAWFVLKVWKLADAKAIYSEFSVELKERPT